MNVDGTHYRTIWLADDRQSVHIIDQHLLPQAFRIRELRTVEDMRTAIADMHVRGAGLIGAAAAYGMYLAALTAPPGNVRRHLEQCADALRGTRPTAANLAWAVNRQLNAMSAAQSTPAKIEVARRTAAEIADEDAEFCRRIGEHGLSLIRQAADRKAGEPVNILTHCNAGWLAFVDYGSATAPIYAAHDAGIPVHVWVDETRPRNQGAALTAWELGRHGVPHTLIVDNAGGHLMQHGLVDMVLVGTDRTTRRGDVANKIGTYLKALAAVDNRVPFYVALPSSSFDFSIRDGLADIPIEQRDPDEVRSVSGHTPGGAIARAQTCPDQTPAVNYGFDVTPARLVTNLITERGICPASEDGIATLFPNS